MWIRTMAAAVGLALCAQPVLASDQEAQLLTAINDYRAQLHRCAERVSGGLPALSADQRLRLPVSTVGGLQEAMGRSGYPMANVQAISLSGPRDAQTALAELNRGFCQILLDPQFVDIAISHQEREWKVVLARPLLAGGFGDWQAEGNKLLLAINRARSAARQCGAQGFAATQPLAWNTTLATTAEAHSRAMANGNFFDHRDPEGRTPGDRAELAGFSGGVVGENIAAALDSADKVVKGWLGSPTHCANVMSPRFTELGAAYAVDPKSDAGIYWTALLGGQ